VKQSAPLREVSDAGLEPLPMGKSRSCKMGKGSYIIRQMAASCKEMWDEVWYARCHFF